MFRRVLVMLDDTPAAARILPWVRRLVAPVGGDVRLLTVLPPARALVADARTVAYADQREDAARLAALLSLETLATVLRDDGLVATSEVRFGDPPSAALDAVREWGAEVLAVADGPRRGWRRLLPSVADALVRRARVPVLALLGAEPRAA